MQESRLDRPQSTYQRAGTRSVNLHIGCVKASGRNPYSLMLLPCGQQFAFSLISRFSTPQRSACSHCIRQTPSAGSRLLPWRSPKLTTTSQVAEPLNAADWQVYPSQSPMHR